MAVSVYDKTFLNADQQKKLQDLTDAWNKANAAGDTAGMEAAHSAAEAIRKSGYNYSGGGDGSGFNQLPSDNTYTPVKLPSYRAQTDAVNQQYDAALNAQVAALKTAFDSNNAVLEEEKAKIPALYQAQRNNTAAQSELQSKNFNEYAAASGLNTGAAGQAALSRLNQLQNDLTSINRAEADAVTDVENRISRLKTEYQNQVAEAAAKGEYEKAAALLSEYRAQEESMVSVAQAQADENYKAHQSAVQNQRYSIEDARYADELAYSRGEDARKWAYQIGRDEKDDAYRDKTFDLSLSQFDFQKKQQEFENALNQAKFDFTKEQTGIENQQWQQSFDYQQLADEKTRQFQLASAMANYGDFSGFQALGVSSESVNNMMKWNVADDPMKAYWAGAITDSEFTNMMGMSPWTYSQLVSGYLDYQLRVLEAANGGSGGGGGSGRRSGGSSNTGDSTGGGTAIKSSVSIKGVGDVGTDYAAQLYKDGYLQVSGRDSNGNVTFTPTKKADSINISVIK